MWATKTDELANCFCTKIQIKVAHPLQNAKNRQKYIFSDSCLMLIFNPRTRKFDGQNISDINSLLFNNGYYKCFEFHNKITKINNHGFASFPLFFCYPLPPLVSSFIQYVDTVDSYCRNSLKQK